MGMSIPYHRITGMSFAQRIGVLFFGLAAGCATQPEKITLPHAEGNFNPSRMISSRPERDGLAAQVADEHLSDADWRLLEKMGPRPIWEQVVGARKRYKVQRPAGDSKDIASTRAVPILIDEATLPATIIPVGEGQIRIIWALSHFGGTKVTSTKATNRQTVAITVADLAPLVAVVQQQLGDRGTCTALPSKNSLVITCPEQIRSQVLETLARLDTPEQQVEITVKIFEVSQDFDFQQGTEILLNHLTSDGAQSLLSTFSAKRFLDAATGSTGGAPVQGSVLNLMQAFENAGISVDVSFQLLAESGLIQVVSSPRMTVAVGETGYMLAGQELPIQSATLSNGVLQASTTYKPVGVQLYITPRAASHNQVKLHVVSIMSSISGFSPLPSMDSGVFAANLINPIIDSREAETSVTVGNHDTLVISGLRMVRNTTRENKVPFLGDLPGLEWMFKNHRTQQRITDLYFFVTPHLLSTISRSAVGQ